jgi:AcrR family transcriptional regulator
MGLLVASEKNPQLDTLRRQLLDTAEELFYARGIQAVGMDEIRSAGGLALRRIYQLYPTKEELVIGVLDRRDLAWRGRLAAYVEQLGDPRDRVLGVFDWLHTWFEEPGFRGCAWINAFGELGSVSPAVAEAVREHKRAFHAYIGCLVQQAEAASSARYRRDPSALAGGGLADAVCLLAEGAIVTAAIMRDARAALRAKATVSALLAEADSSGGP